MYVYVLTQVAPPLPLLVSNQFDWENEGLSSHQLYAITALSSRSKSPRAARRVRTERSLLRPPLPPPAGGGGGRQVGQPPRGTAGQRRVGPN